MADKCSGFLRDSPFFESISIEARESINKQIKDIHDKFGPSAEQLEANLKPLLEKMQKSVREGAWNQYYNNMVITEMESGLYNSIKKKLGLVKNKKDYEDVVSREVGNFFEVVYQRQNAVDVKVAQELASAFQSQNINLREFYHNVRNNPQFSENIAREIGSGLKRNATGDQQAFAVANIFKEFSDKAMLEWQSVNPHTNAMVNYMGRQGHSLVQSGEVTAEQWYNAIKDKINHKVMYDRYGIENNLQDYKKLYNQIKVGERNIDSPFELSASSATAQLTVPPRTIIFDGAEAAIWYNREFNNNANIWDNLIKPSVGLRKKADLTRVMGTNPLFTMTKLKQGISSKLDGTVLADGTVVDHALTDRLFGYDVQGSMFEKTMDTKLTNLNAVQLNDLLGNNRAANGLVAYIGQKTRGITSSFALGKAATSAITDPGKFYGLKKVLQHNTGETGEFITQAAASLFESTESFVKIFTQSISNFSQAVGIMQKNPVFQQQAKEMLFTFEDVFAGMVQESISHLVKPNMITKSLDNVQQTFSWLNFARPMQETEAILANTRVLQNLGKSAKLGYDELSKDFKNTLDRLKVDQGMWDLIRKHTISEGVSGQPKIDVSLVDNIKMKDILQAAKDSDYISTLLESRGVNITKAKNDISLSRSEAAKKAVSQDISAATQQLNDLKKQSTSLEKRIAKEKSPETLAELKDRLNDVNKEIELLDWDTMLNKETYREAEMSGAYTEDLQEGIPISERRRDFRDLKDIEKELVEHIRYDIQNNIQNQVFSSINAMVNIYRNKGTSASDAVKSLGTRGGTIPGELIRSLNHLLSWPFALRENITKHVDATTAIGMFGLAIAGDMMRKSLHDVIEGREIRDWTKADNIMQSVAYSQVWGVYMEYLLKLANVAMGEEFSDKVGSFSPVIGKGFDILKTTGAITRDLKKGIQEGEVGKGAVNAKDRLALFAKRTFTQYPAQYLSYQMLSPEAQAKDDKKRLKRK